MEKNYFQRTTSPSQVVFDTSGQALKRSYIGPFNYLSQERIERALTPTNLNEELKKVTKNRKREFENTKLRGKHAPSSIVNNPGLVKVNKGQNSSFLVSSPTRKRNKHRITTGSTENIRETNNQDNIIVEDRGLMSQNVLRRRKRTCGCSSAIQISTPKGSVFTHLGSGPFSCKEQAFTETLKDTRKERTVKNFEGMSAFWSQFKKRCKQSVRLKKPYSLLQLSDDFPQKAQAKREQNAQGVQSGLNKWLFSLRKSNDAARKHYERCTGSKDPNRALWAQVNEEKSYSKIKLRKPVT